LTEIFGKSLLARGCDS